MQDIPLFTPVEDRRVFKAILLQLEQAIVAGRLAAGDRLPSERELAQQFDVSRTSVREALRVIEALGVVRVRPGPEHGATVIAGSAGALGDLLQFQLALRHVSVAGFVEFRLVIEEWAARAAAEEATEADLTELATMVDEMRRDGLNPVGFQVLDAGFHLAIARVSGNDLLVLILEGLRNAIEQIMLEAITAAGDWEQVRARLVREHQAILDAMGARDGMLASRLIGDHIEQFYRDSATLDVPIRHTPAAADRIRSAGEARR